MKRGSFGAIRLAVSLVALTLFCEQGLAKGKFGTVEPVKPGASAKAEHVEKAGAKDKAAALVDKVRADKLKASGGAANHFGLGTSSNKAAGSVGFSDLPKADAGSKGLTPLAGAGKSTPPLLNRPAYDPAKADAGAKAVPDSLAAMIPGKDSTWARKNSKPESGSAREKTAATVIGKFEPLLAKADQADRAALETVVRHTLERIEALPKADQAAELQKLEQFAAKLEEKFKSADAGEQAELRKFAASALLFYGGPGSGKGLEVAIQKLEAFSKDPAAFNGLANYLSAYAKAYAADVSRQASKGSVDFVKARAAGVDAMKLFAHATLKEKGFPKAEADETIKTLDRCAA